MRGLSLGLKPMRGFPDSRHLEPAAEARAAELRDVWSQYVAPVTNDTGEDFEDFEDFYESAARLEAAMLAYGADNVWMEFPADDRMLVNAETRDTIGAAAAAQFCEIYGLRAKHREHDTDLMMDRLANEYPKFHTFVRHAGRTIEQTGHDLEGLPGAELVPTVLAHAGNRIVVKMARAKHGMWFLDIAADAAEKDVYRQLMDATDWQMISSGGRPGAFIVQGYTQMHYEYRVFIVNGVPVSGAGCVEHFTPLDNEAAFDPKVEKIRNRSGDVSAEPAVVDRLVKFASRVALELQAEVPDLRDYVMDVALDSDNRPLVIELNGLLNAGLYASDPRLVVAAQYAAAGGTMVPGGRGPRRSIHSDYETIEELA